MSLRVPSPLAAARRFATSMPGQVLLNTAAFTLPEELRMREDWRVLGLSCGRAGMLRVLAERAGLLDPPVGVDPSRALLLQAQDDMAREGGPAVVLVQGAGDALPFADDRFELVLAGHALRHLPDERVLTALREVRRVLKPGGLFLAWDFGPTRSQALNRWHGWLLSQAEGTARLRSYRQLRTLAIEAGFDWVDQAHLRPFVFPPIPRVSIVMGKAPHGWRRTMVGGRTAVQYVPGEAEEAGEIPQRRA